LERFEVGTGETGASLPVDVSLPARRKRPAERIRSLVDQAIQGDAEAFGGLYDLFIDDVYRYFYHHVGSPHDAEDLASMYGTSYGSCSGPDTVADPKEPEWVLDWLERTPPGSFVDYGCGGGDLLVGATTRGWRALGVELAPDVVNETSRRTGLPVLTVEGALAKGACADVLHLGDVLEHLTDLLPTEALAGLEW